MRRQFLAAAFAGLINPARMQPPTLAQRIATIKDIPPIVTVRSSDRLPLSQGLFTGIVTVAQLFSTAPVAATGTPFFRRLGDRLADCFNAKDYGAALDGQTDDSVAIQVAQASAGYNPVYIPAGTAAVSAKPDALVGRFSGDGQVLTGDGFRRARMFARRASAPTNYGVLGDISTAFNGDMSTVQVAIEHRIDGDATLTKPTSGYAFHHENSAVSIYYQNKSGFNALANDQGGRTGCAAISARVAQEGQGDASLMTVTGTVFGTNPNSTHFLANPAVVLFDGDLFGFADGTYQQVDEFSHNDYGCDVAVSSTVRNLYRTNNTGAKGAWWVVQRFQSFGSVAVDAVLQPLGKFNNVLDTSRVTAGPSGSVITMAAGQRIYLNARNDDNYANAALTKAGDCWLGYNTVTGKVEVGAHGVAVIQASADGIAGKILSPISTIYRESGPIDVSDSFAVISAPVPVQMTLDAASIDGHDLIMKRLGQGSVAVSMTLDGRHDTELMFDSETLTEAVRVIWSVELKTWLLTSRMVSDASSLRS